MDFDRRTLLLAGASAGATLSWSLARCASAADVILCVRFARALRAPGMPSADEVTGLFSGENTSAPSLGWPDKPLDRRHVMQD